MIDGLRWPPAALANRCTDRQSVLTDHHARDQVPRHTLLAKVTVKQCYSDVDPPD